MILNNAIIEDIMTIVPASVQISYAPPSVSLRE